MITNKIHLSDSFGGRLDPHQFHFERMDMIQHIYDTNQWCKLKDVVINVKTITTKLINSDIYVGLENIESNSGEYIPTTDKESISSAAIFKKGDILFPKLRPYLNKVYRAEFDGKCSTEFHVFEAKNIDADYLTIVLRSNIIVAQTKHLMTGNTLPRLQTSDIENIIIPKPIIQVQKKIVDLYSKVQQHQQVKAKEAKTLLSNIDDYLLNELGISVPQTPERQLSFKVNISEITGQRLDTSFYKDRFELTSSIYPHKKLSDVVQVNPSVDFKSFSSEDEISFIPMDVIDEKFGLIPQAEITSIYNIQGFTKFVEGDLLWAKITPCMQNGKSAIARNLKNGVGCGSTEFFVLRPKSKDISIDYVYCLLRHHKVLEAAKNAFGGSAGQQRVSVSYLKSIKIPIPILEKQIEIAETINKIKGKAKQLQHEGTNQLEITKIQIEKIILG